MIEHKIKELPEIFKQALPLLIKLKEAGFPSYFVGGSLRDFLLNDSIHDVDIATSALPLEVKKIFPHSFDTGIQHGTITVVFHKNNYEITTFRSDGDYLDHRHPKNVNFVTDLKEDLARRDFTINALAMSSDTIIYDYYNGLADLKENLINCVGDPNERFTEDALRMMRALRFVSQLDFKIQPNTYDALKRKVELLKAISIERIHSEFIKLMQGQSWLRGLALLKDSHVSNFMPNMQAQNLDNLFINKNIKLIHFKDEDTIWASLFFLEIFPSDKIIEVLKKWKTSNNIIKNVMEIIDFCYKYLHDIRGYELLYGMQPSNLEAGIFIINNFSKITITDNLLKEYNNLPIHNIREIVVNGGDLIKEANFRPGVELGKMIKFIEREILAGRLFNDRSEIMEFVRRNNV